jgi:hypothetical protein
LCVWLALKTSQGTKNARGTAQYLSFFLSGRKNASEKERTHACAPEPHKITAAAGEEKTNSVALVAEQRQPSRLRRCLSYRIVIVARRSLVTENEAHSLFRRLENGSSMAKSASNFFWDKPDF